MTWRFFAITPGDARDLRPWIDALAAGARVTDLVVREPERPAEGLAAVTRHALAAGLTVWLHSRNPHAFELSTELDTGVHLASPAPHTKVRHGRSTHTAAELDAAFEGGAEYAVLSPVHVPTSKPDDVRSPLGVDVFLALAAGREVIALGGIDPGRARALKDVGAAGVAVLGDLFGRDLKELAGRVARYP